MSGGLVGSVVVLLVVLVVSWLIVLGGALAYELTGLDREAARFQALSAFTGVGFTTRVSELVVRHPTRRRITSALILLGYAGTAGVVASMLETFHGDDALAVLRNLGVVVVVLVVAWWVTGAMGPGLADAIRRIAMRRFTPDRVPHEELMLYKRGYGITRIEVPRGSRVAGFALRELDLRAHDVQVLAVEEGHDVHPIPSADWVFRVGQHLVVYGRLEGVQDAFAPLTAEELRDA